VWEQSIMLIPTTVQIIGLSATLDRPEKFANWIETVKSRQQQQQQNPSSAEKIVYLASKHDRAVPLIHYSFITTTRSIFKTIKDKTVQEQITNIIDKPFVIQTAKGTFNEPNYHKMTKMLKLFAVNNVVVRRQHALNQCMKYLTEKEMTPAICYIFSKAQIEQCSTEITVNLLEFDSKTPYIVDAECESIIRKLPNFKEFLLLPEYVHLVKLLRKGIATHHAGMLPILREIVEILFAKGVVKLLFATETVAVGLNLPVKTTIFTDVNKFDGVTTRCLRAHEYTQASGRAGRLGIDTVGHVIHLNNLFRNVGSVEYKKMLGGGAQTLVSKFKISSNLMLNLIAERNGSDESIITTFIKRSMIQTDVDIQLCIICSEIEKLDEKLDNFKLIRSMTPLGTPREIVIEYIQLSKDRAGSINKRRKAIDKAIAKIVANHRHIETDKVDVIREQTVQHTRDAVMATFVATKSYVETSVAEVMSMLADEKCTEPIDGCGGVKLTQKGLIASHIRELHCIAFANIFEMASFKRLTPTQLVCVFSCFTKCSVKSANATSTVAGEMPGDDHVSMLMTTIAKYYDDCQIREESGGIQSGQDFSIQHVLLPFMAEWCECDTADKCAVFLRKITAITGIFLGEFVKAVLKINNISDEFKKIAELTGNIQLLDSLQSIPELTLKFVVTSQSLYV